jgi:hypothetical protein
MLSFHHSLGLHHIGTTHSQPQPIQREETASAARPADKPTEPPTPAGDLTFPTLSRASTTYASSAAARPSATSGLGGVSREPRSCLETPGTVASGTMLHTYAPPGP